jgi:hypothetical protein
MSSRRPSPQPAKTSSISSMSKEAKQLQTFYNVSYTDYCGLSLKSRTKTDPHLHAQSLNFKRKTQDFWKQKKGEPTMESGDSLRVEQARMCDSPRGRQERVKTEYSNSRIFRTNRNRTFMDFYRTYELEFLEKKLAAFGAVGHKLQLAKFTDPSGRGQRGPLRPNTAYLKRPYTQGEPRKIKTIGLKSTHAREENFFAISGWEDGFN